jgi:hypothetical protein
LPAVRVALIGLLVGVALAGAGCGGGSNAGGIRVPEATGLGLRAGADVVRRAGLCWEIGSAPKGGAAIVLQAPPAGAHVPARTQVRLYLGQDYPARPGVFTAPQAPGCPAFTLAILRGG